MPESYKPAGTIAANPFSADPDPNVTPPGADRLFNIPDRAESGRLSTGVKFYAAYTTPSTSGITLDGTVWVKDAATGNFIKAQDFTVLGEFEGVQIANVAPGAIFVQFTAISTGTINTINLFGAPL